MARVVFGGRGPRIRSRHPTWDGLTFDSTAEMLRYQQLRQLEQAGVISALTHHPKFTIVPTVRYDGVTYRKRIYEADSSYTEEEVFVVEDVKGFETEMFRIKRQIWLHQQIDADYLHRWAFRLIDAEAYRAGDRRKADRGTR